MSERRYLESEAQLHARAKAALLQAFPPDPVDPDGDEGNPDAGSGDEFLTGTLEGLTDFYEMVDALIEQARQDMAVAVGLKAQADAYALPLYDRATRLEIKAKRTEERLLNVLLDIGEKKINRQSYDLSVRAGGNPPVHILDPDKLPTEFWRQKEPPRPEPDLKAIKQALQDPARRDALANAATLGNPKPSLAIKYK
jgi:hypothetical protein